MQYFSMEKGEFWGMPEITVAGAGIGSLTQEVIEAISRADAVCASPRFAKLIPSSKKFIPMKNFAETFAEIDRELGRVVILVSGDPGMFSLLPIVKKRYGNVSVLPGISSLQALCARIGESWHDAVIVSAHGRNLRIGAFLNTTERSRLVVLFCDGENSPRKVCEKLSGIDVEVIIGENLGCENEHVFTGKPGDFVKHDSPELSLMLIRNHNVYSPMNIQPRDSEFVRAEGIVMTNEAVRSVILGLLNLKPDSILWDIGAGTGSISVSAGLEFPQSEIHAVEYKPEALRVIAENSRRFHLHNIDIHAGRALGIIETLPPPSHVFIGGSEGELAGILDYVSRWPVRVVIACVTLETLTAAYALMKDWQDFEAVQVSISASKTLSPSSTLMKAQSPVTILSALSEQKFSNIITM